MLKFLNYNNCKDIIIFILLFYLLLKSFKKNKEHMTSSTDPNIDMEAIVNLSNFVKQYHTKIENLSNLLDQNQSLTFPKIKAGNKLCIGSKCMNLDNFTRLKDNTYDKGAVDRMISDINNKINTKQNSGPYVTRNTWYRLYSDRDQSLHIESHGWKAAKGAGNASSWGPGYRFQISQENKG